MTAPTYEKLTPPTSGTRVAVGADGRWNIPDDPIVCLIRGDGIGRDVGGARHHDLRRSRPRRRRRQSLRRQAHASTGSTSTPATWPASCTIPQVKDEQVGALSEEEQRKLYLPDDTLKAFEHYSLGLKGPLTTPIGGGFRSINVYLRMRFDLYACVRPVRYFKGVEAPNKRADKVDMVIFRENTEDVYCGIEFKSGSDKAKKLHRPAQGNGLQRTGRRRASASSR